MMAAWYSTSSLQAACGLVLELVWSPLLFDRAMGQFVSRGEQVAQSLAEYNSWISWELATNSAGPKTWRMKVEYIKPRKIISCSTLVTGARVRVDPQERCPALADNRDEEVAKLHFPTLDVVLTVFLRTTHIGFGVQHPFISAQPLPKTFSVTVLSQQRVDALCRRLQSKNPCTSRKISQSCHRNTTWLLSVQRESSSTLCVA